MRMVDQIEDAITDALGNCVNSKNGHDAHWWAQTVHHLLKARLEWLKQSPALYIPADFGGTLPTEHPIVVPPAEDAAQ